MKLNGKVRLWLKTSLDDPIVKILTENSQLTEIQLETLLIDSLHENIIGKRLKCSEKAGLRLKRAKVSRGAFNRTLRQARENVIRSIYTIMLLGYLGLFETAALSPYLEIADRLQNYLEVRKDALLKGKKTDYLEIMEMLRRELEASLKRSSKPLRNA